MLISAGDNFDRIKSEATFAHLCGAAPIPAAADAPTDTASTAAVTVALTMRSTSSFLAASATTHAPALTPSAAPTKAYSKPEIIRCLKRYVAREIFNALPVLIAETRPARPLARP